jgi:hypothetical protein
LTPSERASTAPSEASPRISIAPAKPALERWRSIGARVAVAVLTWLVFQATGGGTTPGGRITPGGRPTPGGRVLDQLENAVKTPLPGVPAPQVTRPDRIWVPDRYVVRPDGVLLHVPAHWERPISTTEVYVPPLIACPTAGECVMVPAGPRPPVEVRPGP